MYLNSDDEFVLGKILTAVKPPVGGPHEKQQDNGTRSRNEKSGAGERRLDDAEKKSSLQYVLHFLRASASVYSAGYTLTEHLHRVIHVYKIKLSKCATASAVSGKEPQTRRRQNKQRG